MLGLFVGHPAEDFCAAFNAGDLLWSQGLINAELGSKFENSARRFLSSYCDAFCRSGATFQWIRAGPRMSAWLLDLKMCVCRVDACGQ